jgi:hypothetical protein
MKTDLEHYHELRDRFYASEGVKLYNRILSLQLSFYSFDANFRELHRFINLHFLLQQERRLGDWNNRRPLHDYLMELTRLLHNFLASAKSLVDHTRNFVKQSYGEGSTPAKVYEAEVDKRFTANPLSRFTQDLRNVFTHVNMPFISSVLGGSQATGRDLYTLKLNIKKIEHFDDWHQESRQYIAAAGSEIDLELYAIAYYRLIYDFYDWLGAANETWAKEKWENTIAIHDKVAEYERRWHLGT